MPSDASLIDPRLKTRCDVARSHLLAGRLDQSERIYREVLAQDPRFAPAVAGLGDIAMTLEAWDDAERLFGIALGLDPRLPRTRTNLGLVLRNLGRDDEAVTAFRQATLDDPGYPMAHYWLGLALLAGDDVPGAVASLSRALSINPDLIGPFGTSLYNFFANCEWRSWDKVNRFMAAALDAPVPLYSPMNLMLTPTTPAALQQCARALVKTYFPLQAPMCAGPHPRRDKIRIGYVSTDLNDHPVGYLLAGVLEHHDRSKFEISAFYFGPDQDNAISHRLRAGFDHFHSLEKAGVDETARAIRDAEIDIAVDLNGYTTYCRPEVFARRAAPVQVNHYGFTGTMGAPYIDYIIADRIIIPQDESQFFDEKIVWMPTLYIPTDNKAEIGKSPTRAQQGLPDEAIVLMAYNRTHKVSPVIFAAWMRILRRTEGTVVWTQDGGEAACENLRREAVSYGVDPDRLVFAKRNLPRPDHVARHRLADLFIDTLPYNAHSTASDALWAGLPVVTCRGKTFPGRVCATIVEAAGFPELVTETLQQYEDLIVALASDRDRLAALKARTAREAPASPLFDTARYTRELEAAFNQMYEISQAGRPPESFSVQPV